MSKRYFESGASKRKRKAEEEAFHSKQRGAILNFVTRRPPPHSAALTSDTQFLNEEDAQSFSQSLPRCQSSQMALEEVVNESANLQKEVMDTVTVDGDRGSCDADESQHIDFDWKDPGLWPPSISNKERVYLVEKGPFRESGSGIKYPQDKSSEKRHFSVGIFWRKLRNGECADRRWLVYSNHKNAVFCFCCILFSDLKTKLTSEGNSDWKNMSSLLADHESSMKHIRAIAAWIELENRLKEGKTIDKKTQKLMQKETQHWNNVLQRIISIVQFLAERNLPFRGTVDRLFQPNNGFF